MSKPNSLMHNFKRKVIRADFKPSDHVPEFTPTGWSPVSSSKRYLALSSSGRFFDQLWRFVSLLLFGFLLLAIFLGWRDAADEMSWWLMVATILMAAYSLWMILINQAYLRWMFRNRKR